MSTTTITITAAVDSAGLDELVNELNENDENQYEKPAAAPSLCARMCVCLCACTFVCLCCVHTFGIITYAVCYTHMHRQTYQHAYACVLLYVPNSEQPPV